MTDDANKIRTISEEQMQFANRIYDTANRISQDAVEKFGPDAGFSLTVHALLVAAAQIVHQASDPQAMWNAAIEIAWRQAGEVIAEHVAPGETRQ